MIVCKALSTSLVGAQNTNFSVLLLLGKSSILPIPLVPYPFLKIEKSKSHCFRHAADSLCVCVKAGKFIRTCFRYFWIDLMYSRDCFLPIEYCLLRNLIWLLWGLNLVLYVKIEYTVNKKLAVNLHLNLILVLAIFTSQCCGKYMSVCCKL